MLRPRSPLHLECLEDRCLMASSLSITDNPIIYEGHKGTSTISFAVTLSEPSEQTITVDYSTVDGTAKAKSDYLAAAGTLTFAPGETTKYITIAIKGDTQVEGDESFRIDLFGAVNALIEDGTGIGLILNDDFERPRCNPRHVHCGG